jgi:TATA-box binding protein (TBP) (component of TFIID and TFIIIB)
MDYISYSTTQENYKNQVKDYYLNKRFYNSLLEEEGADEDDFFSDIEFTEGDANVPGYYSPLCNDMKYVLCNFNQKILFNPLNSSMVNERVRLNKIIHSVNKSFQKCESRDGFKLNDYQIEQLDKINIYYLCDDDFKVYLKLKLKDNPFISQKVVILNEDLHFTIVNNVFTYYLCKENTFNNHGNNELYDLPISFIYKLLMNYGITKDYQRSKIVLRFRPQFRSSILVFRSGINVSTGSPNPKMADFLAKLFVRQLRLLCGFSDIDIAQKACQNKVAAAKIRFGVCLNLLAHRYGKNIVQYNPAKFAGAIVKISNIDDNQEDFDKITLLVFGTRKIICVGSKNEDKLKMAYLKLYDMLLGCAMTPENIKIENELKKTKLIYQEDHKIIHPSGSLSKRGGGGGIRGSYRINDNIFKRPRGRGISKGKIYSGIDPRSKILHKPRGRPRKIK